jgi:hypothetical protein
LIIFPGKKEAFLSGKEITYKGMVFFAGKRKVLPGNGISFQEK